MRFLGWRARLDLIGTGKTGPGEIYFLPPKRKMNAHKYQKILERHLKPKNKTQSQINN